MKKDQSERLQTIMQIEFQNMYLCHQETDWKKLKGKEIRRDKMLVSYNIIVKKEILTHQK